MRSGEMRSRLADVESLAIMAKARKKSPDSRKRLTPAKEERGPAPADILLGVDDPSLAPLAARVRESGRHPHRSLSGALRRQASSPRCASVEVGRAHSFPAGSFSDAYQAAREENRRNGSVPRSAHRGPGGRWTVLDPERKTPASGGKSSRAPSGARAGLARRGSRLSYPRPQYGKGPQPQGQEPRSDPHGARARREKAARARNGLRDPVRRARSSPRSASFIKTTGALPEAPISRSSGRSTASRPARSRRACASARGIRRGFSRSTSESRRSSRSSRSAGSARLTCGTTSSPGSTRSASTERRRVTPRHPWRWELPSPAWPLRLGASTSPRCASRTSRSWRRCPPINEIRSGGDEWISRRDHFQGIFSPGRGTPFTHLAAR